MKYTRFIIFLVIQVFLGSCSGIAKLKVTISGMVVDTNGDPVPEASVTIELDPYIRTACCNSYDGSLSNCKAITDSSGRWTYVYRDYLKDGAENKNLTCSYSVSKEGYATVSGTYSYCWSAEHDCSGDQTVKPTITLE